MAPSGTDESTERRKLRPRERTDPTGRLLEDLFDAVGEHGVTAFPALLWTLLAVPPDASGPMLGGYLALIVALAVVRRDRIRRRWLRYPAWPDAAVAMLLLRVVYYNAAVVAVALLARAAPLPGPPGSPAATALAIAAGGLAGLAFPVVAAAVRRSLGGGPRARPRDVNVLRADRERNRRKR